MTIPINPFIFGTTQVVEIPNVHVYDSERHRVSRTVTQYPIESGAEIVDHAIRLPMELTLRGFVSATAGTVVVTDPAEQEFRRNIANQASVGVNELLPREVWAQIVRWHERNEVLTVVTQLGRYQNMVIENAEVEQTVETGINLPFEVRLRELQYAAGLVGLGDDLENNTTDRAPTQSAIQAVVQEVSTVAPGTTPGILDTGAPSDAADEVRDLSDVLGEQINPFALDQLEGCVPGQLPRRITRIELARKSSNDAISTVTLEGRDYTIRVRYAPISPLPYWSFQLDVGSRRVINGRTINVCTPILNPGNGSGLSGNFYVVQSRALPDIDSDSGPHLDGLVRSARQNVLNAGLVPRFGWGRTATGRGWYDLYYVPSIGSERAMAGNEALGL